MHLRRHNWRSLSSNVEQCHKVWTVIMLLKEIIILDENQSFSWFSIYILLYYRTKICKYRNYVFITVVFLNYLHILGRLISRLAGWNKIGITTSLSVGYSKMKHCNSTWLTDPSPPLLHTHTLLKMVLTSNQQPYNLLQK